MPMGHARVASFEDMKMDKIGVASLIANAYYQEIEMIGNNGIPMGELLIRLSLLRRATENKLSPYIPRDSEYWNKSEKLKGRMTVEFARMPQAHSSFINNLSDWDMLLMREEARLSLLLTKNVSARV